jgi:hypothetical protein
MPRVRVGIFEGHIWQMSLGERAAVEGVLTQVRPPLAIEIGSAEGACLGRIAAHSEEVHSFDLVPPSLPVPPNVTLHSGDSHQLLPRVLAGFAEQSRNVDFVMVDGDHSPEGVRQDIEDLLDSTAVARSIILIHDAANERVRQGIEAVRFAAWPKVAHVELDWIPGQLFAEPELRNELWYGLGLVIVDTTRPAYLDASVYQQRYHPAAALLASARDLVLARERVPPSAHTIEDGGAGVRERVAELEAELGGQIAARERVAELEAELRLARHRIAALEADVAPARRRAAEAEEELAAAAHRIAGAERALADITGSASWKMTEPLRTVKRRVRRTDG